MKRHYPQLQALYPPLQSSQAPPARRAGGVPRVRPSVSGTGRPQPLASPDTARLGPSELLDLMVYGVDEDDQSPEVHLAFREAVAPGVYLKLRFEPEGIRAIFLVADKRARRWASAYGEQILARLSNKGLRTLDVRIEDQQPEAE